MHGHFLGSAKEVVIAKLSCKNKPFDVNSSELGSSAVKCGHRIHWLMSSLIFFDGLPLRFGGTQGGKGTRYASTSCTVRMWSVIPAAIAGERGTQCRRPLGR